MMSSADKDDLAATEPASAISRRRRSCWQWLTECALIFQDMRQPRCAATQGAEAASTPSSFKIRLSRRIANRAAQSQ